MTTQLSPEAAARLAAALQTIYDRPQPAVPWRDGGNLPWDDPQFSERMLEQHLDQSHGAASRRAPGNHGAGAGDGRTGWGSPRAAASSTSRAGRGSMRPSSPARGSPSRASTSGRPPCAMRVSSPRGCRSKSTRATCAKWTSRARSFDAAIYLYGQFTVLKPEESLDVLRRIHAALRPGAPAAARGARRRPYRQEEQHLVVHRPGRAMGRLPLPPPGRAHMGRGTPGDHRAVLRPQPGDRAR